jgi:osmotically-inducible protein OsmY
LVRGIRGVKSIQDELRVLDNASVFSDEEILLRIERALMRNSLTREDAIAVSLRDGAVVLEGESHSWLARQFAESAAASVMGVETISNEIVVAELGGNGEIPQVDALAGVWWTPGSRMRAPVLTNAVAAARQP